MNVTLKLPDEVCRKARHRAVDESKSLSAWIADLLVRELKEKQPVNSQSLVEMLGDASVADGELPLPDRRQDRGRRVEFP